MRECWLLFPHTLFERVVEDAAGMEIRVVEPALFFTQFPFHRQKLFLHRVSCVRFAERIGARHRTVEECPTLDDALEGLSGRVHVYELDDDWLERDLRAACATRGLELVVYPSPGFLTPLEEGSAYARDRFAARAQGHPAPTGSGKMLAHEFYLWQRRRMGLLLEADGSPVGRRWSFDAENREPLPRSVPTPARPAFPPPEGIVADAISWIETRFPDAPGELTPDRYPTSHDEARAGLDHFVRYILPNFGRYEDAMRRDESFLFHSVLTPSLNSGLLTPQEALDVALAARDDVPIASLEGFVRQLVGWREMMRLVYLTVGRRQRTANALGHTKPLPKGFWDGTTGLSAVDTVVRRVLRTGYAHHIERLMVLSAAMLMLEVHPDAVYRWFMSLFVDAYDWVMVPNVYGVGQFADGGLMTTKPYFASSAYLKRMGDWRPGPSDAVWDALYWRFVQRHRALLLENPRMAPVVRAWDETPHARKSALGRALREWRADDLRNRDATEDGASGGRAVGDDEGHLCRRDARPPEASGDRDVDANLGVRRHVQHVHGPADEIETEAVGTSQEVGADPRGKPPRPRLGEQEERLAAPARVEGEGEVVVPEAQDVEGRKESDEEEEGPAERGTPSGRQERLRVAEERGEGERGHRDVPWPDDAVVA